MKGIAQRWQRSCEPFAWTEYRGRMRRSGRGRSFYRRNGLYRTSVLTEEQKLGAVGAPHLDTPLKRAKLSSAYRRVGRRCQQAFQQLVRSQRRLFNEPLLEYRPQLR